MGLRWLFEWLPVSRKEFYEAMDEVTTGIADLETKFDTYKGHVDALIAGLKATIPPDNTDALAHIAEFEGKIAAAEAEIAPPPLPE